MPDVLHFDSFDRDRRWWEDMPFVTSVTMHGFGWGSVLSDWNTYLHESAGSPHDWHDFLNLARRLRQERQALEEFDHVIPISTHEEWLLRDTYALDNVTEVVPNPVARYFFERPQADYDSFGPVLCVGNPGTSGNRNFGKVVELFGKDNVEIASNVPREKMPEVYDRASVLALPTYWAQGFDLTVAEAWARGRPVVAFATGSYYNCSRVARVPPGNWARFKREVRAVKEFYWLAKSASRFRFNELRRAADLHRPDAHVEHWLDQVTS